MKFNSKYIISCFFLALYLLVGVFGSGCASICLGNEHSKHIGINMLGYEPCCEHEKAIHNKDNYESTNKASLSDRCECNDYNIKVVNIPQSIHSSDSIFAMFDGIKTIKTDAVISSLNLGFTDSRDKINWNIYRYPNHGNSLKALKTIVLII